MTRPSRPLHLMRHALLASERSTCSRLNVGALIFCVSTRAIVSTGYNGPPSGDPHCGAHCVTDEPCIRSTHAETNALDKAILDFRWEYDIYITHSPCAACAQRIYEVRAKVQRLFFGVEFRSVIPLADLARVMEVYKVTPAGYITRYGYPIPIDPESLYA